MKLVGAADHDAALYFGDANDAVEAGFWWDTSAQKLFFQGYNNTTRMTIDNAGNVGLGITSPASNLHVYEATNDTAAVATLTGDGETAGDVFARIGAQNLHHGTGANGGEAHIDFRMASYQHSDRDGADILMSCLLYTSPSPRD